MPDEDLYAAEALNAARASVSAEVPGLRPATVTAFAIATNEVRVRMDGADVDARAEPTFCDNITGRPLVVGQRVMVDQRPPHGNYIVGVVGLAPDIGCSLRRTSLLQVNAAAATDVPWTIEDYDPFDYFPGSGVILTVPNGLDGLYGVVAQVDWSAGTNNLDLLNSLISISAAGVGYPARGHNIGNLEWSHSISPLPLVGGDQVIIAVFQTSGDTRFITSAVVHFYRIEASSQH